MGDILQVPAVVQYYTSGLKDHKCILGLLKPTDYVW